MARVADLLGDNLVNSRGEVVATKSRASGVVGLYFSAHWCPPCREFTPKLVEFYEKFRKSEKGTDFEIVYVSSDKDAESFKNYLGEMPWLALPFSDRDRKCRVTKKLKVDGIPALILLDSASGEVISRRGRESIISDPDGASFPWRPKSVTELLSGKVLQDEAEVDLSSIIKDKIVGLYFSAHWCPPCRAFTPKLVDIYDTVRAQGKPFEIVFVSADRSAESFQDYSRTMPWPSVPYSDPAKEDLPAVFHVQGIPALVLLDKDLEVITKKGRAMADLDPQATDFPWYPQAVERLTESSVTAINETACMILFTGGQEEWIAKAAELLKDTALAYRDILEEDEEEELPDLCFLFETKESKDIVDNVAEFVMLDEDRPLLVILDVPEQKKYVHIGGPITRELVKKLADDFRLGKLEMISLPS